jgi:hypothetical protein
MGLKDDRVGTTGSRYSVMVAAGISKEASCNGEVCGAVELNRNE